MKTSIVPAQITTVEDKIAGSLTLQQVVLLLAPLLLGFVIFVVMPPTLQLAFYKVVLVGVAALISGLLAIRVKDRMLLFWLLTIVRYNTRPRYYVYSKNDSFLRDEPQAIEKRSR